MHSKNFHSLLIRPPFPRGSRRNKIHPRGNPAVVRSIPAVFPQHSYTHPPSSSPCTQTDGRDRRIAVSLTALLQQKGIGSPYSTTAHRVPELIPVFGSQPAGDVSHKPGGRLPLLSARPAVTPATLKRAVTNFAAWRTEARWV